MRDTISDGSFAILDSNFDTLIYLDHYESLMWIDRYNQPGEVEIFAHPLTEVMEAAQINNYIWSSLSDRLMIIENVSFSFDSVQGIRYIIKGRSLESILDRRVLLYKTVFQNNLEDACRQIIDWGFMRVTESGRNVSNFTFKYSGDSRIRAKTVDYEYEPGTTILTCVTEMCQNAEIGFKITVNDNKQFVFELYMGENRSYDQETNPWIIFSPKFNNLISDKLQEDATNLKNFVFVVGEEYNDQAAEWIRQGSVTGLLRRELYENASDINHEVEDINGNKTTLTAAQYTDQLKQRASDRLKENKINKEIESQVDPNVNFEFNKDYFIGDVIQLENGYGYDEKARVSEFIVSHSTSGLEMYPTFETVDED